MKHKDPYKGYILCGVVSLSCGILLSLTCLCSLGSLICVDLCHKIQQFFLQDRSTQRTCGQRIFRQPWRKGFT